MIISRYRRQQNPAPAQPASSSPPPPPRRRKPQNLWVMPWILQREERGCYRTLLDELITTDIPDYRNFTRMQPAIFALIEERITPPTHPTPPPPPTPTPTPSTSGSQSPTSGSHWKSGWNWQLLRDTYPQGKATPHWNTTGGLEERPSANLSPRSAKPFWKNFNRSIWYVPLSLKAGRKLKRDL